MMRRRSNSPRSEAERRGPANDDHGGARYLIVHNISMDTYPLHLRECFERFGPLEDVYVPRNKYTGRARGYAFVDFKDTKDASEALAFMNFRIFRGRRINVTHSTGCRKYRCDMRNHARISQGDYRDGSHRPYPGPQPDPSTYPRSRSPHYRNQHSRSYSPAPRSIGNKSISPHHSRSPGKRSRERSYSPAPRCRGNDFISMQYSRSPDRRSLERSYSPAPRHRRNDSVSPRYFRSPNRRNLERLPPCGSSSRSPARNK